MKPNDLVFDTVYKRLLAEGCDDRTSREQAMICLEDYKKSRFSTVSKLIDSAIVKGKKMKIKKRK
jgi:hypothetical protein